MAADKDDLIQELAAMLVDDPEVSSRPWNELVIVARVDEGVTDASGFAYQQDGSAVATGPENFDILDKLSELRGAMAEPGREPWKACLIRIDGNSGKFTVKFEYENPEKWAITPGNAAEMAELLRTVT